jgi:radical SAM protein with 4Fe4S-binding SPASM domain
MNNITTFAKFYSTIDYDYEIEKIKKEIEEVDYLENETLLKIYNLIKENKYEINEQEVRYIHNYPNKILEYIQYRFNFRHLSVEKKATKSPIYILIEPTSICNLRCPFCFQIDDYFRDKDKNGFINLKLFRKIIDDAVNSGVKALTMASRGEPLLHPDFNKMLDYVKGKFLELKINTNAMLLDEKMINAILRNEVNEVVFSIESTNEKDYSKKRVGGDFNRVLENIKKFNEIRKECYKNSKTNTRISGVILKQNEDQKEYVRFWSKYVDYIATVNFIDRNKTYKKKEEYSHKEPCSLLWNRMYIWWNGDCNPCDYDYKSELKFGNLKINSIEEIWNSDTMQKIRETHLLKLRNKLSPCNVCEL